ncbi:MULTISPECIES: hypothetical protein [Pseudomonas]|uniref:Uncharacterized protein n=1 Tax=Pseudomonas putida TaxID=303 RepID=A0A1L5PWM7_PSEPU|nr:MULTISPECIES: hypothetical protein [Pseudomonas]APO84493.1 hypothetical protein BL240_24845 [Pseudomonas putida]MDV5097920.1 hypothetical protein [Pseudomonas sp. LSJ-87]
MNEFLESLWGLGFLAMPFALFFAGLSMTAQLAYLPNYRKLQHALRRSEHLKRVALWWGERSFYSRVSVVATLSGIALNPEYFLKRGLLDPDDASNFPASLRKKMRIVFLLLLVAFIWSLLAAILIKLKRIQFWS